MNSASQQYVTDDRDSMAAAPTDVAGSFDLLRAAARRAIDQTRKWLVSRQDADGSWCAELEGDTILESETILLLVFLGREDDGLARRLAAYLLEKQLPEGGWAHVSRRTGGYQRQREGLFRPEAHRSRSRRRTHAAGAAARSWPAAGPTRSTATRGSIWPCWGRSPTSSARPCRRSSCCCPSGFRSTCSPSAPGRGRSSCRCRSSRRCARCGRIEPRLGIRELFLSEPERLAAAALSGLARRRGLLSWDRFFRTVDAAVEVVPAAAAGCRCGARPWRPPSVGCSPASTAATAWGRSYPPDGLEHRWPCSAWAIADDSPEVEVLPAASCTTW